MTAKNKERNEEVRPDFGGLTEIVHDIHSKVTDILSRVEDNYRVLLDLYEANTKENGWYEWFDEEVC